MELLIPESHPCFEGHFPDNPVIPGALLLQYAISAIRNCAGVPFELQEIRRVKFQKFVLPGSALNLEYNIKDSGHSNHQRKDSEKLISFKVVSQNNESVMQGILAIK